MNLRPLSDTLVGGPGDDLLDGGDAHGEDLLSYRTSVRGVRIDLAAGTAVSGGATDRLVSLEDVMGSDHDDRIVGTNRIDGIQAKAGDDRVIGLGGGDVVRSGKARDRVRGGAGPDAIYGQVGSDRLWVRPGHLPRWTRQRHDRRRRRSGLEQRRSRRRHVPSGRAVAPMRVRRLIGTARQGRLGFVVAMAATNPSLSSRHGRRRYGGGMTCVRADAWWPA